MRSSIIGMSIAAVLVGCDGDATPGTPDPDEGSSLSQLVTVAEGGVLVTPSGGATLTVSPGAVEADMTLTVEVGPMVEGTLSSTYEFGPDGTTFDPPAQLVVSWDGAVGARSSVGLSVLDGNDWNQLRATWRDGDTVVGEVEHFSTMAISELADTDVCVDGQGGRNADGCTVRIRDCTEADEYNLTCTRLEDGTSQCDCLGMPEDLFRSSSFGGPGCFEGNPSQAFVNAAMGQCGWNVVYEYDSEYFLWDE